MDIGTILMCASLITSLLSFTFSIISYSKKSRKESYTSIHFMIATFVILTLAFAALIYYFLHTNRETEWYYRIAWIWSGREGSMFLLAWLIILALSTESFCKGFKRLERKEFDMVRGTTMLIISFLLLSLILDDPFNSKVFESALGINPALENYYMIFYAPILFAGYALITLVFSYSIAFLITKNDKMIEHARFSGTISWLLLTTGIALGGLWAYSTASFDSYWNWDAVETASMLPWLFVTVFLHSTHSPEKAEFKVTPLLAGLSFLAVLFTIFVVRSGVWSSTYPHAHNSARDFISTLADKSLLVLFILALTSLIVLIVLLLKNLRFSRQRFKENYIKIAVIMLFSLISLIIFVGLIVGVEGLSSEYFNSRLAIFAVALIVLIILCIGLELFKPKNITYITIATLIVSTILASIFEGYRAISFITPMLIVVLFLSALRLKKIKTKRLKIKVREISSTLIHVGVVLLLLGYAGSNTMSADTVRQIKVGDEFKFEGYSVKLYSLEGDEEKVNARIVLKDGDRKEGETEMVVDDWGKRSTVYIARDFFEDVRIKLESIEKGDMLTLYSHNESIRLTSPISYSNSPSVVLDSDGNVHLAWTENKGENFVVYYGKLENNRIIEQKKISRGNEESFSPHVITDLEGNVHIIWKGKVLNRITLRYSKVDESGNVVVNRELTPDKFVDAYDAEIDSEGDLHVVYRAVGFEAFIFYSKVLSNGSFQVRDKVVVNASFNEERRVSDPSLESDSQGRLHLIWQDHRFGKPVLYYKRLANTGDEITKEKRITDKEFHSMKPQFTLHKGTIHLIWIRFNDLYYDIMYKQLDLDGKERLSTIIHSNASKPSNLKVLSFNGTVYSVWQDFENKSEIFYSESDDGKEWMSPIRISEGKGESSNPTIAIAENVTYIIYQYSPLLEESSARIAIKKVPMISFVWSGVALMITGSILRICTAHDVEIEKKSGARRMSKRR